jgi:hypothetical protein
MGSSPASVKSSDRLSSGRKRSIPRFASASRTEGNRPTFSFRPSLPLGDRKAQSGFIAPRARCPARRLLDSTLSTRRRRLKSVGDDEILQ